MAFHTWLRENYPDESAWHVETSATTEEYVAVYQAEVLGGGLSRLTTTVEDIAIGLGEVADLLGNIDERLKRLERREARP